jgi:hypothetical protein
VWILAAQRIFTGRGEVSNQQRPLPGLFKCDDETSNPLASDGGATCVILKTVADTFLFFERYTCSLQAYSFSLRGWGLIDLPLRASNEDLLRPHVARAPFVLNGPSKLARYLLSRGGPAWSPTAHVERPLLHRGGSVSTGDQPGHPSPCYCVDFLISAAVCSADFSSVLSA